MTCPVCESCMTCGYRFRKERMPVYFSCYFQEISSQNYSSKLFSENYKIFAKSSDNYSETKQIISLFTDERRWTSQDTREISKPSLRSEQLQKFSIFRRKGSSRAKNERRKIHSGWYSRCSFGKTRWMRIKAFRLIAEGSKEHMKQTSENE